ncbi:hypothetical protein DW959_09375 [Clostridium sp. AM46-21]|nr:hypothetical protein DW959_09375 [Clostridium sp. AM46-21]
MYNDRIQPSGDLLSEDCERNDLKYSVEGTENRQREYIFRLKGTPVKHTLAAEPKRNTVIK